MNENNFVYQVFADDTTGFVDNSDWGNCNVFKKLIHVEFRRAKPINRSSLLNREERDYTDEFVIHGFELYEAEELIKELSRSDRWVNIYLEKHDIDDLYREKLIGVHSCAELIEDRETGEYGFGTMILDSGLEVDLTLMLKSYPYPKRENIDEPENVDELEKRIEKIEDRLDFDIPF